MSQIRTLKSISERELDSGIIRPEQSWHFEYKDQAYVFIGGLNKELTEGDIITIFSQYGVVVDILLMRDKNSGESRGFGYLKYEDQRSTILAIDNLNGSKIAGRPILVDHTFFELKQDMNNYRIAVQDELAKDFFKGAKKSLGDVTKGKKKI